jgi:hypothetical protein
MHQEIGYNDYELRAELKIFSMNAQKLKGIFNLLVEATSPLSTSTKNRFSTAVRGVSTITSFSVHTDGRCPEPAPAGAFVSAMKDISNFCICLKI